MKPETPCHMRDLYGIVHEYYISFGGTICGRRPGWTSKDLVENGAVTCIMCLGAREGEPYSEDAFISRMVEEFQRTGDESCMKAAEDALEAQALRLGEQ